MTDSEKILLLEDALLHANAELERIRASVRENVNDCCDNPRFGRGAGHGFCESYGCETLERLIDPAWEPAEERLNPTYGIDLEASEEDHQ